MSGPQDVKKTVLRTGGGTVTLTPDGSFFFFDDDTDADPLRPVVPPDEGIYAYAYGGDRYRAAIRAISMWKSSLVRKS